MFAVLQGSGTYADNVTHSPYPLHHRFSLERSSQLGEHHAVPQSILHFCDTKACFLA